MPKPMSLHEATDQKSLYTDFRPLNGSQEDVDLLVVYDDGEKLAVLIIEAKGSASFDKVQLARKIVRLDSIIADSGASSHGGQSLKFRLVLAAPSKPQNFDCCLKFVNSLPPARPGEPDRFKTIREALEKLRPDSIGTGLHFLEITGFPKPTFAVERSRGGAGSSGKSEVGESDGSAGTFTHWALKER